MRGVSSAATLLFKESLHLPSIVLPDPVSIVQIPIGIIFVCESKISRTRVPQMGYKTGMPDSLSVYDVSGFVEGVVLIPRADEPLLHTSRMIPAFFGDGPHPADGLVCGLHRNYFMWVGSLREHFSSRGLIQSSANSIGKVEPVVRQGAFNVVRSGILLR